jgi:Ca-activated chloride channel family protein
MTKKENQFEANISRIVKSTKDTQQPSEQFTSRLINEAMAEVVQENTPGRQNKSVAMKTVYFFMKIAAVLLVIGFLWAITVPSLNKCKQINFAKSPSKDKSVFYDLGNGTPPPSSPQIQTESLPHPHPVQQIARKTPPIPPMPPMPNSSLAMHPVGEPSDQSTSISSVNQYHFAIPTSHERSVEGMTGYGMTGYSQPMAHGGSTPPNGEPYDAMFFKNYGVNPFVDTDDDNLSTFATDVDTGSFTMCRQYLLDGNLPPNDAVRVEEFVNYFHYNYPAPQHSPFAVYAEAMPWNFVASRQNTHLMRIGLKGMEISEENRKPAILTFVIDVSGSMERQDRLELVKQSLTILTNHLRPDDKIGIAVYGSQGEKVMSHQGLRHKSAILKAIQSLHPNGSTNAEEGIRIGYDMAEKAFDPDYINRVILCSDGVANVGQTGPDEIFKIIKAKADKGITLSALGFGMENYNDVLMEQLGDKGNGYYAYIDTLDEAQKLFGENLTGALQVIARDVKVQVEFNPKVIRSYRLIGYENRNVADKDFRNDKVDGGEMGAGYSATALYELKLWPNAVGTAATVFVRYKDPDTFEATEFKCPFQTSQIADPQQVSSAFALAARVTEFAEILRKSYWAKQASLENTLRETRQLAAQEPANTEIRELVDLMKKAIPLLPSQDNSNVTEDQGSTDPKLKPLPIVPN